MNKKIFNAFMSEYTKSTSLKITSLVKNIWNKRRIKGFDGLENVKTTNLQVFMFNNDIGICYFSEDDLPNGIRTIENLKGKFVCYMFIFRKNGVMPYFGSTNDLGLRMNSHAKDGLSDEKELYNLMREEKYFLLKVLSIHNSREEAEQQEEKHILNYRDIIGRIAYHQNINNFKEKEIRELIKPYMCNISKNTKHG